VGGDFWVKIKIVFLILRGSFGAAKFLMRMLTQSNFKENFFLSLGKKCFFPEALETICKRQQRFLKISDVLGTLKII
jgi:hypothetical protein